MYKVSNTERIRGIASEYETKSLLYLLSMRKDSSEIQIFIIDFFNDVTGASEDLDKLWDIQAKGVKTLNPKKIGIALYTLYKNYISEVKFNDFILFIPKLKEGYLMNESLLHYDINNFKSKYIEKVKEGLLQEFKRRNKLADDFSINDTQINEFIKKVNFVLGKDDKELYIKNIIDFKNNKIKNKEFFITIFDEIRNRQTAIKNDCIEEAEISAMSEILDYHRHINKSEIEILIINRLIGIDIFNDQTIPISFVDEIKDLNHEERKDTIQECNERISKTFFNKNNKRAFWRFLEEAVKITKKNYKKDINTIYQILSNSNISIIRPLNRISTLYFLSLIKDGMENED